MSRLTSQGFWKGDCVSLDEASLVNQAELCLESLGQAAVVETIEWQQSHHCCGHEARRARGTGRLSNGVRRAENKQTDMDKMKTATYTLDDTRIKGVKVNHSRPGWRKGITKAAPGRKHGDRILPHTTTGSIQGLVLHRASSCPSFLYEGTRSQPRLSLPAREAIAVSMLEQVRIVVSIVSDRRTGEAEGSSGRRWLQI